MTEESTFSKISETDLIDLKNAKASMEDIGVLMQGLNKIGGTMEKGLKYLPESKQQWLSQQLEKMLFSILKSNLKTMKKGKNFKKPTSRIYKALVTTTGATSGFFGSANLIGTPIFILEMGISTKFIMRTIMDIARSEGEDIYTVETQLACLQVFALGGNSKEDDGVETSYYTTRLGLSSAIKSASSYISTNGLGSLGKTILGAGNPIAKVIGVIASRFTAQVSEKAMLQIFPVAGAITGGSVNYIFINYFQKMAKAHFTIRRLERKYGKNEIIEIYTKELV